MRIKLKKHLILEGLAGAVATKAAMVSSKTGLPIPVREDDRWEAAKQGALYSAGGTALLGGIGAAMGSGVPLGAVGIVSGLAGAKGGAMSAAISGGRDTLTKSSLIPAAIVAGTAPLTNMALDAADYDNIEVNVPVSAAITGGLGALGWHLRNDNNKKKQYI